MKLRVADRINLTNILPERGTYVTMEQLRLLRAALALNEDEIKRIEFTTIESNGNHSYQWEDDKDKGKKIDIPLELLLVIKNILVDLDKEENLTSPLVGLYKIFVEM